MDIHSTVKDPCFPLCSLVMSSYDVNGLSGQNYEPQSHLCARVIARKMEASIL